MAQPVWVLSVDLQTKTATFQSGMAEAARSAKGAFSDIRRSADEMSEGSSKGFGDMRHSLGLLDNSIRGQHGAAMADAIRLTAQWVDISGAMPFAAMAGGILLVGGGLVELAKHIREAREEQEKLASAQTQFNTTVQNTFNGLDAKLLQAGIRADQLNKDHLAALAKQLKLIDLQSMDELAQSFEKVKKAADDYFKDLQVSWYSVGIGSAGAMHALKEFKDQYESLLSQQKETAAADLLAGTLASAEKVLAAQQLIAHPGQKTFGSVQAADAADAAATKTLSDARVGFTEKEIAAQERLIDALKATATIRDKVSAVSNLNKSTTKQSTGLTMEGDANGALVAQMKAERKAQADEERLQEQARTEAVGRIQQTEREKIAATDQGSRERLAAIDAAIKEEDARGLQETGFYRGLLTARLGIIRQMAAEDARIKETAGKEEAAHSQKMAALTLAAQREHQQLLNSARRVTALQVAAQETETENAAYQLKLAAFAREIQTLDKNGKDYRNKLKTLQDRETELTQQHENKVTEIKVKAEIDRNNRVLAAERNFDGAVAQSLASVLGRQQSFGAMMLSLGNQIVSGMIQNAVMSMLTEDMTKPHDAAAAARKAYIAGMHFPFPANIVMAPTLAAGAFAAVMAFEKGGEVPGVGRGDVVPAMLTPGEHVSDTSLTDGLKQMVRNQGNSGYVIHVRAHFAPTVHALDTDGIDEVLTKHQETFQKHLEKAIRKLNH